ncbi:uncharacterized protein SPPG_07859 [Spizellomyces punctatus DAOM BR117]|uniref:Uncharacterized protein n=1 Tax=Spizellomyces punctatus (strain DAOM BR117) TaxID=645134 RepID=A0A0L0H702_SPIPD|nr:uncharacterized protein SPPG_07859 [Spizellomyces punctatus DAOM BR117]KNC96646.1 hypothetical protein SPPG_07859 [Spizellomyces punctatus DAOM BR117]|eukprot:XP_016604686.1 hypothetical protein SPPG_07859 [Spizellomyces punctatus DAOM BR117]
MSISIVRTRMSHRKMSRTLNCPAQPVSGDLLPSMTQSTVRRSVSSSSPWEATVGYCRAVRKGTYIAVSGTTSIDQDTGLVAHKGDAYLQTKHILSLISQTLKSLDASIEDVIRTRMFVTNIKDWEQVGKAHGEIFGNIRPAATMVEVKGLIDPDLLVEIEVDAIVG